MRKRYFINVRTRDLKLEPVELDSPTYLSPLEVKGYIEVTSIATNTRLTRSQKLERYLKVARPFISQVQANELIAQIRLAKLNEAVALLRKDDALLIKQLAGTLNKYVPELTKDYTLEEIVCALN